MKTNSVRQAKIILLLFLIAFPLMVFVSSCRKDHTGEMDIRDQEWLLQLVEVGSNIYKVPKENFHLRDAYILKFEDNSIFRLNLSSNVAGGLYVIPVNGTIDIDTYSNFTEVAITDFDSKVLEEFKKMNSYTVKGKILTFMGDGSKVRFKKI